MRTNRVIIIIGSRNSGKTTLGKAVMLDVMNSNPEMLYALVIDTFDHPSYRNGFVRVAAKMIKRIVKRGLYRIFGSNINEIMAAVEQDTRNAFLMFEDAAKYLRGQVPDNVRNFILDSKQKNLDIVFMFHGFGFVPPDLYRLVDGIYLLRTNDSPATRKGLIPCYDEVKAAYDRVRASDDKYPRESILLV